MPSANSGYKQKACHNFCSPLRQFYRETKLSVIYLIVDSGSGQFLEPGQIYRSPGWQKLRHGVLPAGIVYWLKNLDR